MPITKVVDDRINMLKEESAKIKAERAELDALKIDFEKRESALREKEKDFDDGAAGQLERRKAMLQQEVDNLIGEVGNLKAEKKAEIQKLVDELEQTKYERTAFLEKMQAQEQEETARITSEKLELEAQCVAIKSEMVALSDRRAQEFRRHQKALDEEVAKFKEAKQQEVLSATEAAQAEIDALGMQKDEVKAQIEELKQMREKTRGTIETETQRLILAQQAEAEKVREQLRFDTEKEKMAVIEEIRELRVQKLAEIDGIESGHLHKLQELEQSKRMLEEQIELLQFQFEKVESENNVQLEALKAARMKELDEEILGRRKLFKAQLDAETATLLQEQTAQIEQAKNEKRWIEEESAQLMTRMDALKDELALLPQLLERGKVENASAIASLRETKLKEVEDKRLLMLEELEQLKDDKMAELDELIQHKRASLLQLEAERQNKIEEMQRYQLGKMSELEKAHMAQLDELEAIRAEKMDTYTKAAEIAHQELEELKKQHHSLMNAIKSLQVQSENMHADNEALRVELETELEGELERLRTSKMEALLEKVRQKKESVEQELDTITKDFERKSGEMKESVAALTEKKADLEQQIDNMDMTFNTQKIDKLADIENERLAAMEELSQMRLDKMREINEVVDNYRTQRLASIEQEIEKEIEKEYQTLEDLKKLNAEYDEKMRVYKNDVEQLREREEQLDQAEKVAEAARAKYKEAIRQKYVVVMKEKEQQTQRQGQEISLLRRKVAGYEAEISAYREDLLTGGGKTRKELIADGEFLKKRVESLEKALNSR